MSERPERDPFEDEIRRALQSVYDRADRPGVPNSDDVLQRIHRRVDRRRKQRRVGVFFATAAMIAAITVVVPFVSPTTPIEEATDGPRVGSAADRTGWRDARTSEASPSPPPRATTSREHIPPTRSMAYVPLRHAGAAVRASNVLVSSVSGSSSDEFYLSASATCGRGICNVLGRSGQGDAPTFTELPGSVRHTETTVRFSGNGQSGWMTNGAEIFRTDDGGQDWSRLRQPRTVQIESLETWGDQVWVVGSRGSQPVVFADQGGGSGMLQKLKPAGDRAPEPDLAVALGEDAFGVPLTGGQPDFAYTIDGGAQWDVSDIGCDPADLSATKEAVWAFCDDSTPTLVRSVDQGRSWESPQPLTDIPPSEEPTAIAAISANAVFVVSGSEGWVVDSGIATRATGLGDGPYVYAGFTTQSVGYVIDGDGSLCRTDDGGASWTSVPLP